MLASCCLLPSHFSHGCGAGGSSGSHGLRVWCCFDPTKDICFCADLSQSFLLAGWLAGWDRQSSSSSSSRQELSDVYAERFGHLPHETFPDGAVREAELLRLTWTKTEKRLLPPGWLVGWFAHAVSLHMHMVAHERTHAFTRSLTG